MLLRNKKCIDLADKFYYLGNMLITDGGADAAVMPAYGVVGINSSSWLYI